MIGSELSIFVNTSFNVSNITSVNFDNREITREINSILNRKLRRYTDTIKNNMSKYNAVISNEFRKRAYEILRDERQINGYRNVNIIQFISDSDRDGFIIGTSSYYTNDNEEFAKYNGPIASFIEYGTGILGSETQKENMNLSYSNNKWKYVKNDTFYSTLGQKSTPFMYRLENEILRDYKKKLKKQIKVDIKK